MNKIRKFLGYRMRALIRKEFRQILRDRRLAISLILPPTLQLLLFGFALNATVSNLRLGVVDDSRTPESRELVAIMTESKSFKGGGAYIDVNEMSKKIADGNLDAGLVIPYDYARDLQRGRPATVQVLLNAMNSNTATIGQGYAQGVIASYNQTLAGGGIHARFQEIAAPNVSRLGNVIDGAVRPRGGHHTERLADFGCGDCEGTRGRDARAAINVSRFNDADHRCKTLSTLRAAVRDGNAGGGDHARRVRNSFPRKCFVGDCRRSPLPVVRDQHWHLYRHIYEISAAGATHAFFRQPSADFALRSVHAGGSDAEMATACRAIQSHPTLRHDLARRDVERKRDRNVVAEFPRAFGVHRRARLAEHLAIQKTT
jgi:hypothetical protein